MGWEQDLNKDFDQGMISSVYTTYRRSINIVSCPLKRLWREKNSFWWFILWQSIWRLNLSCICVVITINDETLWRWEEKHSVLLIQEEVHTHDLFSCIKVRVPSSFIDDKSPFTPAFISFMRAYYVKSKYWIFYDWLRCITHYLWVHFEYI